MGERKTVRLIDELGRVVLPIEARQEMEWGEKTPVEIWVDKTAEQLIIKRHTTSCVYCGATENLKEYRRKYFCQNCQNEIAVL